MLTLIKHPDRYGHADPIYDTNIMGYMMAHAKIKENYLIVEIPNVDPYIGINGTSYCNDILELQLTYGKANHNVFVVLDISNELQDSEIQGTRYALRLLNHHYHNKDNEVPYFYAKFKIMTKSDERYRLVPENKHV